MANRIWLSFLLASAVLAVAETRTDFSGIWKIDLDKSDFGGRPSAPEGMTVEIRHSDPELILTQIIGEERETYRLITDGTECSNPYRGSELKSRLNWDKKDLLVDSKLGSLTMKDRMTVSEDGLTMTILRHISTNDGDQDLKLIFHKSA